MFRLQVKLYDVFISQLLLSLFLQFGQSQTSCHQLAKHVLTLRSRHEISLLRPLLESVSPKMLYSPLLIKLKPDFCAKNSSVETLQDLPSVSLVYMINASEWLYEYATSQ